jgi:hypothetical protein
MKAYIFRTESYTRDNYAPEMIAQNILGVYADKEKAINAANNSALQTQSVHGGLLDASAKCSDDTFFVVLYLTNTKVYYIVSEHEVIK